MREFRYNPIVGEWVLFSPKPDAFIGTAELYNKQERAVYDPDCSFCPGNEDMLTDLIEEMHPSDNCQKWQTRVVWSQRPVVEPSSLHDPRQDGERFIAIPAEGRHEIIIEHPDHNIDIHGMNQQVVGMILHTYQDRYTAISRNKNIKTVFITRHRTRHGGNHQQHPHSQCVAFNFEPTFRKRLKYRAFRYAQQNTHNLFEDLIFEEFKYKKRILLKDEYFLAFIPYAASVPFEIWIMPLFPSYNFSRLSANQISHLALLLLKISQILEAGLHSPEYDLNLHSFYDQETPAPFLRWFITIRPRLNIPLNVNWEENVKINPHFPEADAEYLQDLDSRNLSIFQRYV